MIEISPWIMTIGRSTLFVALCCLSLAVAAAMPFWGASAPAPFTTPSDELKDGEFTWAPEIAPSGPIAVLVSLDEQRAYTYRNGILIGTSTVSTGKPGHETPTGVFTTKLKDADHHSSIYNNAPMPYTQRITNDGIALHAGGVTGVPGIAWLRSSALGVCTAIVSGDTARYDGRDCRPEDTAGLG